MRSRSGAFIPTDTFRAGPGFAKISIYLVLSIFLMANVVSLVVYAYGVEQF